MGRTHARLIRAYAPRGSTRGLHGKSLRGRYRAIVVHGMKGSRFTASCAGPGIVRCSRVQKANHRDDVKS